MAGDPRMRASDSDRDRTAALLREHHAVGRLTAEEFKDRLELAYEAKTLGELDQLLADLPAIDLYELPDASLRRPRRGLPGLPWPMELHSVSRFSPAWRAAWASCASVSLLAFLVWLLTGHPASLWFLWVAGPYSLVLIAKRLAGGPPRRYRHRGGGYSS
jgi:DUF1707 SHOCT-like domain